MATRGPVVEEFGKRCPLYVGANKLTLNVSANYQGGQNRICGDAKTMEWKWRTGMSVLELFTVERSNFPSISFSLFFLINSLERFFKPYGFSRSHISVKDMCKCYVGVLIIKSGNLKGKNAT